MRINWSEIKKKYPPLSIVTGIVVMHAPFGIFLNIGLDKVLGVVDLIHFLDDDDERRMEYSLYPPFYAKIEGVVIAYDKFSKQVKLSVKPASLEKAREEQKNKDAEERDNQMDKLVKL